MSAQVVDLATRREREVGLSYEQFRVYLQQRGHSVQKRWLQYRRAEGLPHYTDMAGRVRFLPSEAMPWLEAWAKERGRGA